MNLTTQHKLWDLGGMLSTSTQWVAGAMTVWSVVHDDNIVGLAWMIVFLAMTWVVLPVCRRKYRRAARQLRWAADDARERAEVADYWAARDAAVRKELGR